MLVSLPTTTMSSTDAITDLVIKACKNPSMAILRFCASHGFNLSAVIEEIAMTPLMLAIESDCFLLARTLFSDFSIDATVQVGDETALSIANRKLSSQSYKDPILVALIRSLNCCQDMKVMHLFSLVDVLDVSAFSSAVDIHLSKGGVIDCVHDDQTLLMMCVDAGFYDHAKVLIEKGADPWIVIKSRSARSIVKNHLDDDFFQESVRKAQDFLDYLLSLEPFELDDGSIFHGSFKDSKPFKGTLTTKDGATVPGFFDEDDKFIVSLD